MGCVFLQIPVLVLSDFFFGCTDIDEWYLEGLKYTVERLDVLLEMPDVKEHKIDLYYSSSW